MTDAEISRRLALAIGHRGDHIMKNLSGSVSVYTPESPQGVGINR